MSRTKKDSKYVKQPHVDRHKPNTLGVCRCPQCSAKRRKARSKNTEVKVLNKKIREGEDVKGVYYA